jgi:hypothetical protein
MIECHTVESALVVAESMAGATGRPWSICEYHGTMYVTERPIGGSVLLERVHPVGGGYGK